MKEKLSEYEWGLLRDSANPQDAEFILKTLLPILIAEYDALAEKLRVATDEGEDSYFPVLVAERHLFSHLTALRDEALRAIAHYDDPVHIPTLQRAIEQETNRELRADMQKTLAQLQETLSKNPHTA